MIKRILYLLLIAAVGISCDENPLEIDVSHIEAEAQVKRYDRDFFDTTNYTLSELKTEYPYFFDANTADQTWEKRRRDEELVYLSGRVDSLYPELNDFTAELSWVFKHYAHYYPDVQIPTVYTYVGGLDMQYPVLFIDSALFVALDVFLGADAPEYAGVPSYITERFSEEFIVPKVLKEMAQARIDYNESDLTLINSMVYWGKVLYFAEAMYPDIAFNRLFEYSTEQVDWANKNEANMWEYLIREDLLFDRKSQTRNRFLDEAPFSKFYAGIDRQSPGRIGRWIGWRIVHSYMESNPEKTLIDLLENTDNQAIFAASQYKPFFE